MKWSQLLTWTIRADQKTTTTSWKSQIKIIQNHYIWITIICKSQSLHFNCIWTVFRNLWQWLWSDCYLCHFSCMKIWVQCMHFVFFWFYRCCFDCPKMMAWTLINHSHIIIAFLLMVNDAMSHPQTDYVVTNPKNVSGNWNVLRHGRKFCYRHVILFLKLYLFLNFSKSWFQFIILWILYSS